VVVHGDVSTGHGADDKDDGLVLRQGTGQGHGVVEVAFHGEAVALVAGGEVAGDGVLDHFEKGRLAIGGADFKLVEELDCVCGGKRERERVRESIKETSECGVCVMRRVESKTTTSHITSETHP
jgi:hypothetical protein